MEGEEREREGVEEGSGYRGKGGTVSTAYQQLNTILCLCVWPAPSQQSGSGDDDVINVPLFR